MKHVNIICSYFKYYLSYKNRDLREVVDSYAVVNSRVVSDGIVDSAAAVVATGAIKSPPTVVEPTVVADSVEVPVVAPGVVMSTNTISRDNVSTF